MKNYHDFIEKEQMCQMKQAFAEIKFQNYPLT